YETSFDRAFYSHYQERKVSNMSFPANNQSIRCDVCSCKHHENDGKCELESITVSPRCDCSSGDCDESLCASYRAK
ncbi:MAG: DUF1540 domain-containing protein, partial [Clostridia bacterium]